jgi:hypothetical protein
MDFETSGVARLDQDGIRVGVSPPWGANAAALRCSASRFAVDAAIVDCLAAQQLSGTPRGRADGM